MASQQPLHSIHEVVSESMAVIEEFGADSQQASDLCHRPFYFPGFGRLDWGQAAPANIFALGSPGSGKTQCLMLLLRVALAASLRFGGLRYRCVIGDHKREFYGRLLALGVPASSIAIVNPFDRRGAALCLQSDFGTKTGAATLSHWVIPKDPNANDTAAFFDGAARGMLRALILHHARLGELTLSRLVQSASDPQTLERVLKQEPTGRAVLRNYAGIADDKMKAGVFATLYESLESFAPLAQLLDLQESRVSIQQWAKSSGILLVSGDPRHAEISEQYTRLVFERVFRELLSKPVHDELIADRTLVLVDELKATGDVALQSLPNFLSLSRGLGCWSINATQNLVGLHAAYGESGTEELLGLSAGKIFTRLDSPSDRELASKLFGESQRWIQKPGWNQSQTFGKDRSQTYGQNVSYEVQRLPNVSPHHFNLPRADRRWGAYGFSTIDHRMRAWRMRPETIARLAYGPFRVVEPNFLPWPDEHDKLTESSDSERREGGRRKLVLP